MVLLVLWRWIDGLAFADAEKKATAQLDTMKIAASIAVGGGGLFALYLAARRQRTQELELETRHVELRHREAELAQRDRVQAHAEQVAEHNRVHAERIAQDARDDAEARRVTELYAKSVEQLGSDQAPVRLGGLYALERLAQSNVDQRQTVVDLFCAYLRMAHDHEQPEQENQVRLTIQRTLTKHLRPGEEPDQRVATFWEGIDLDLGGAALVDFTLQGCRVGMLNLNGAQLLGDTDLRDSTMDDTSFAGAHLHGAAGFDDATFTGAADFTGTQFDGVTWFPSTTFHDNANFTQAKFNGELTRFNMAKFHHKAQFRKARFAGSVGFELASFAQSADFIEAEFRGPVMCVATFAGKALFFDAVFDHDAVFCMESSYASKFGSIAGFTGALFGGDAIFTKVSFQGRDTWSGCEWSRPDGSARRVISTGAQFTAAVFKGNAIFDRTKFDGPASFDNAAFGRYVTFEGGEFADDTGTDVNFRRAHARLDVPDHFLHRVWPAGYEVSATASQPEFDAAEREGRWGWIERLPASPQDQSPQNEL
ncbi:MAG TPA: pentapeptide repeat-containing protein [Pseudonocardiaceae bacterium]|nr:pentapeptide repeat-containing protein [Pseudonocardiaceae bacterium]